MGTVEVALPGRPELSLRSEPPRSRQNSRTDGFRRLFDQAVEDPYVGSDEIRRRAADRAGAHTAALDGLGHWWMVQDPDRGAAALTRFWEPLD